MQAVLHFLDIQCVVKEGAILGPLWRCEKCGADRNALFIRWLENSLHFLNIKGEYIAYIMSNIKRSRAEWIRRYASFVVILFVIAFGTSLSIRANLGSSPISAPPYVLSLIPGMKLTMGQLTICMHVFFILSQILLLRKDFSSSGCTPM